MAATSDGTCVSGNALDLLGQCPLHRTALPQPSSALAVIIIPQHQVQDESIHQTRRATQAESTSIPPKTVHPPLSSPKHHSVTTPHDSDVLEERLLPTWSYGTKLCSTPNNKKMCTVAEQISSIGHWRPSSLNLYAHFIGRGCQWR